MSSLGHDGAADDSVICLDSSVDITIENDNDTDDSPSAETVNFEKTLPPGVAPDGFIIIDEVDESERANGPRDTLEDKRKDEDSSKPMFKIVFRDETVSRLYKKRVQEFFCRLVAGESRFDDSTSDNLVLEIRSKRTSRKRSHDHLESESADNPSDEEEPDLNMLFRIEKRPMLQNELDVPTYGKKFEQILDSTTQSEKPEDKDDKTNCRRQVTCFNCMGNHSIRDCSEPRNYMQIAKNRNEFAARSVQKVGRYHVENGGQKFERFVPGQISRDLKRALGIKDNQLPQHIYRMRILGYPPGWLKEAKVQHSGMNLYNSDGALENNYTDEPGEIVEITDRYQYDVKKIQDFPGFNVQPPSGTREDDKKYWKSHRYAANSKESLLAMISERKVDGYKKKKLKRLEEPNIINAEQPTVDMDVVENADDMIVENVSVNGFFIPPLPKSPEKPPLPSDLGDAAIDSPVPDNLDLEIVRSPGHADSPPLEDLEQRKKQLLAELGDSSEPSPPSTPIIIRSSSLTCHGSSLEQQKTTAPSNGKPSETGKATCSLTTPSRGMIKSVDLGTPILESTSPYSKLPAVENFAKDVCDIIHFENLPDSTGKYEQMSGILQKVRTTLAESQQES